MRGTVDYSGSIKLEKSLQSIQNEWPQWLISFLLRQADKFLERVRLRTPVDTGRLQKAWRLDSIGWHGDSLVAEFLNDAYDGRANYASFVEYGHAKPYLSGIAQPGSSDWVMGAFMLTYTIKELQKEMPAELSAEVVKLFRKHGLG